jgi:hypothetical protein
LATPVWPKGAFDHPKSQTLKWLFIIIIIIIIIIYFFGLVGWLESLPRQTGVVSTTAILFFGGGQTPKGLRGGSDALILPKGPSLFFFCFYTLPM